MNTFDHANTVFDLEAATFDRDADASVDTSEADAISGTALRRRLITPEVLAASTIETPKPTLLQRLLHR